MGSGSNTEGYEASPHAYGEVDEDLVYVVVQLALGNDWEAHATDATVTVGDSSATVLDGKTLPR